MGKWVIKFYKEGLYDNDKMKIFVKCDWITADQYKELTGIDYEQPQA